MNMAGVFKTPSVFVCQNNQWAISVPRDRQSASETIAQKAFAYGFEGTLVDGNDVFAVYKTVSEALLKARSGGGPTLVECFTYRMSDHTTADDASRYRSEQDVAGWKKKDPLLRLAAYMKNKGMLSDNSEREIESEVRRAVDEAVKKAESTAPPDPARDLFGYTYLEPTLRQKKELKEFMHAGP
jgi:pyruvate dehydrogenase E1 component alpha subunit